MDRVQTSYVVLPYSGVWFVPPVSPAAGHWILGICAFAALLQLIGLATIVATPTMWFTFSWLFHICESNHNNHYLLMCHLLFVGSFIGWGRWMSVDNLVLWKIGCAPCSHLASYTSHRMPRPLIFALTSHVIPLGTQEAPRPAGAPLAYVRHAPDVHHPLLVRRNRQGGPLAPHYTYLVRCRHPHPNNFISALRPPPPPPSPGHIPAADEP